MSGQVKMQEPLECVPNAIAHTGTEKRKFVIYKVTNLVNEKIYIGQTVYPLAVRKSKHIHSAKIKSPHYFHRAIKKYGADAFIWETICLCRSKDEADIKECEFIKFFNTKGLLGYNMTDGGGGTVGFHLSEETRNKLRLANIGKHPSAETLIKMSEGQKGQIISDVTREKLRLRMTGVTLSIETRAKISATLMGKYKGEKNPNYGKHPSEETREKISKALKGKPGTFLGKKHTKESREKISIAQTGKKRGPFSDDHKDKIRKALQGKAISEGQKAQISKTLTGYKHSDETKAKMSKSRIGTKRSAKTCANIRIGWALRKQRMLLAKVA